MPQIGISWQSSDLSMFTPSSAPALPGSKLSAWEVSVAVQATHTSPSGKTDSASSNDQDAGLSTGAKAGIGVGVAAAVLLIIAIILLLMRRRKKRTAVESSKTVTYLDSKAELDNSGRLRNAPATELPNEEPKELATYEQPQQLSTNREPPPIPFASKPR